MTFTTTAVTWGTPLTLDTVQWSGADNTSLKIVNGNPAISYLDGATQNLKYVRANDVDGKTTSASCTP